MTGVNQDDCSDPKRVIFRTNRRIEFSDTDVAGIVHFSRFYVFMETAEHQFLNFLGTSVHATHGEVLIGWPRLEAKCEFFRPLKFEQTVEIALTLLKLGTKSVSYGAEFTRDGDLVARGHISSVCCRLRSGEPPRSMAIPEELARKIARAAIGEKSC